MRILYINNINEVAKSYGEDMVQRGHTVKMYQPSLAGGAAPLPIKLAMLPGRIYDIRHIVGALKPVYFDLVHIHWASYGLIGFVSHIPFIIECHGSDVRYRLKNPFFRLLLTAILRRAAAVICITPDLFPVVQSIRSDAIFFPGSIDTDRFIPCEGERPRPWTILLFASLDPIKGCAIATQGITQFVQRHPEVRVKLVDWGPEKEKYKQRYGERFEFVPPVTPALVQHLIWSADVVVGQFLLGALGLSELQAMSCAKPVIASFRYETAYPTPPPLCQASTAQEVDEHLENLFQHPEEARDLGQRARKWITDYHSRKALAVKRELLYQSILNERQERLTPNQELLLS